MATVHLVRHGRATGGWDADPDRGLDDVGVAQAAALAERFGPLGNGACAGVPALVTSPMRRCRETADALAATVAQLLHDSARRQALVERSGAVVTAYGSRPQADRLTAMLAAAARAS